MALLVDGKMYMLAASAPSLVDYKAKTATVAGMKAGNTIIPKKLMVDVKEVNISSMTKSEAPVRSATMFLIPQDI